MNRPIQISPQTGETTIGPAVQTPQQPIAPPPVSNANTPFRPSNYQITDPELPPTNPDSGQIGTRQNPQTQRALLNTRVQINPRQSTVSSEVRVDPSSIPGESIITLTSGVRVTITSQELAQMLDIGNGKTTQIVIEADSVVAWTNQYPTPAPGEAPRWELYLEGNVEFVMGDRVAFADRMYYDAINQSGTILDVELLAPVTEYRGLARLKADVIQQLNENSYVAFGAAMTSSRLGVPRYWLQSETVQINRVQNQQVNNLTGLPLFNTNGQAEVEDEYFLDSQNNFIYFFNLPVSDCSDD